jgi:hypothetical protein
MSRRVAHVTFAVSTDGFTPSVLPPVLMTGSEAAIGTSFFSVPIPVEQVDFWRIVFQCPATGAPLGSLAIQTSVDEVLNSTLTPNAADLAVWTPLHFFPDAAASLFASTEEYAGTAPVASFAVGNATTIVLDDERCDYAWLRLVYTATSGTIIPYAKARLKGVF